jgi:aryl-alcohol dehydrogenase-like predicted oxidoreductase
MPLPRRALGHDGPEVGSIGYGAMGLSWAYGNREGMDPDAVINRAIDLGCTLIDTADVYGPFHNEITVGHAIKGRRDEVVLATKCGLVVDDVETRELRRDGRPEHIRAAIDGSLRRLEVDHVDLYYLHRPDPEVPIEESVGALRELLDDGIIRMAGVSNADPAQIGAAMEIVGDGLVAVQNEFSPRFRSSEAELRLCEDRGLAFLPWSPLGGISRADGLGKRHAAFAQVADEVGASPQQVCLAWELAKGTGVVPIPGSSRPETIRASAAAVDIQLSAAQMERLDAQ